MLEGCPSHLNAEALRVLDRIIAEELPPDLLASIGARVADLSELPLSATAATHTGLMILVARLVERTIHEAPSLAVGREIVASWIAYFTCHGVMPTSVMVVTTMPHHREASDAE